MTDAAVNANPAPTVQVVVQTGSTADAVGFELVKFEAVDLTPEIAAEFRNLPPSPTERKLDSKRVRFLREAMAAGQVLPFFWAVAVLPDGRRLRMNGQHSSNMLYDLPPEDFPVGGKVALATFKVGNEDSLALLFQQFDSRRSSRSAADVSGAYQSVQRDLRALDKPVAKVGIEGVAWWRRNVEGLPVLPGDYAYALFQQQASHPFLLWLETLFAGRKLPELRKPPVIAAMYATFNADEERAKSFWDEIAHGGNDADEGAVTSRLFQWLDNLYQEGQPRGFKPANYYQACVTSWNAWHEGRTLRTIRHDASRGLATPLGAVDEGDSLAA